VGQEAIDNSADIIDSRDIIARIEYLEGLDEEDPEREETADELKALLAFQEEAAGYCQDWNYGETLIRDTCFEDYARQLAEDVGAIPDNLRWPCTCIDWERAARELRMDYTSAEFDGATYWFR
jgi:antirestriction protein